MALRLPGDRPVRPGHRRVRLLHGATSGRPAGSSSRPSARPRSGPSRWSPIKRRPTRSCWRSCCRRPGIAPSEYANNRVEADHGRLKARLRPMRGLKQDRSARVIIAGHAFVQNLRRGHYELAVEQPTKPASSGRIRPSWPWRSDPADLAFSLPWVDATQQRPWVANGQDGTVPASPETNQVAPCTWGPDGAWGREGAVGRAAPTGRGVDASPARSGVSGNHAAAGGHHLGTPGRTAGTHSHSTPGGLRSPVSCRNAGPHSGDRKTMVRMVRWR